MFVWLGPFRKRAALKQKIPMKKLEYIIIENIVLASGKAVGQMELSYRRFGLPLGEAPVVLVNHALTGNADVGGPDGWWASLVGNGKRIDTLAYTVLSFNIPGNGHDDKPENLVQDYWHYSIRDVAALFWQGLDRLCVDSLFAIIGGSLGGNVAWEMAAQQPKRIYHLIPVAAHWKATDWVVANVLVQDRILNNSDNPVEDARLHAMLLYRTPESLAARFQGKAGDGKFAVEEWLSGHGTKLRNRFRLSSYKLMNHLLKTSDITRGTGDLQAVLSGFNGSVHIVAVNTDYFYTAAESRKTAQALSVFLPDTYYHELHSIHGHDGFLMETGKLSRVLGAVFGLVGKEQDA